MLSLTKFSGSGGAVGRKYGRNFGGGGNIGVVVGIM